MVKAVPGRGVPIAKALDRERASREASVTNPTHGEERDVARGQG